MNRIQIRDQIINLFNTNSNYELDKEKFKDFVDEVLQIVSTIPSQSVDYSLFINEMRKYFFVNISLNEAIDLSISAAVNLIENDPAYDLLAKKLLLRKIYFQIFYDFSPSAEIYRRKFTENIATLVEKGILDPRFLKLDIKKLAKSLMPERDESFTYLGLETLLDRYLFTRLENLYETPQFLWMRVAMGLSLNERNSEKKINEFYQTISELRFIPSTPTLFHSGLKDAPQLSSCFLTTVEDNLNNIYKNLGDVANLLKYSGGVAVDWTNIRAMGSLIESTAIRSSGLIPFLKQANAGTISINRSGRRRGASVAYLEIWHLEIEEFLDLRRNTGDERRRTPDLSLATWIPDLFMKRVKEDSSWTLFSPDEVPDLHSLYGRKFEQRYIQYEEKVKVLQLEKENIEKEIREEKERTLNPNNKKFQELREKAVKINNKLSLTRKVSAISIWRKILTRLFETGYPWITFKDSCNIRSPQDHVGVVNSSNLCTEITLNTSPQEIAVCNLGSVNLAKHVIDRSLNHSLLKKTIKSAVRMLDNVIDLNFYPVPETKYSNLRHRPIGLGMMGFQDFLFRLDVSYSSPAALKLNNDLTETFSYYAIQESNELAKEKGAYSTFKGSKWDRGIFPFDTIPLLAEERGMAIEIDQEQKMDWDDLKKSVKKYGMRNSNVMAIAPTATIANIAGCFPCIEPIYSNIYVKSNIAGEFTVVNNYLIADLKKLSLWDQSMLSEIKFFEGSIQNIRSIPQRLKDKYRGVFEIDPLWAIEMAAHRSQWIDQSISHNIFINTSSGQKINNVYFAAWNKGLKTTYYLRTLGASKIESSTLDANKYESTQQRNNKIDQNQSCQISSSEEDCESCQ